MNPIARSTGHTIQAVPGVPLSLGAASGVSVSVTAGRMVEVAVLWPGVAVTIWVWTTVTSRISGIWPNFGVTLGWGVTLGVLLTAGVAVGGRTGGGVKVRSRATICRVERAAFAVSFSESRDNALEISISIGSASPLVKLID